MVVVDACRPASSNGSAFSKLAAGVSLTPLKDLAYAFGQSVRDALFGSNVLVSTLVSCMVMIKIKAHLIID